MHNSTKSLFLLLFLMLAIFVDLSAQKSVARKWNEATLMAIHAKI